MFLVVDSAAGWRVAERRGGARIAIPFPAIVRGVDTRGAHSAESVRLDNLSARGLYLRLPRPVAVVAELAVVIHFTLSAGSPLPAAEGALHGPVHRVEPQPDGGWGLAMTFNGHQFPCRRTPDD